MDDGCGVVRTFALAFAVTFCIGVVLLGTGVLWLVFGKRVIATMLGID